MSFKSELKRSGAAVFTIQETHFKKKGKLKVENFEIFESIRKKEKGGTVVGAHKSLNPFLISEKDESFELITIEINIGGKSIRIISGYGPQETWPEDQRRSFSWLLKMK